MESQEKIVASSKHIASREIKDKIKKLPDSPGVYKFLRGKKVLYIGKATSLRDRVRSYFNSDVTNTRSPLISKMLSEFTDIDFIKTDSVLEALVLEAKLIKKFQPEANIKEKDNKSFNYIVITKEDFPRVLVMRERELENIRKHSLHSHDSYISMSLDKKFGPFPNGGQLKEAMKIIRKMFPFRDKCELNSKRGCFNYQIGLCPGVCIGEISKKDYQKQIKNIILFFESDKKKLLKNLEKEMKGFAKNREFEKAQKVKKTIFTLNHIQDISLIKEREINTKSGFRIESYDIAHFGGRDVVGVLTVVEDGGRKVSDYRKFKIKENPGVNDTKALSEILSRRLMHIEWPFPDLIVVDGGKAQKNIMEKVLKENGLDIPVVSVVKNEQHKPKEILGDEKWLEHEKGILLSNSEAHRFAISYHKKFRKIR